MHSFKGIQFWSEPNSWLGMGRQKFLIREIFIQLMSAKMVWALPIILSELVGNGHAFYSTKAHTKVKWSKTVVASGHRWTQRPNIDPIEMWQLLFPRVASLGHRLGAVASFCVVPGVCWRQHWAVASRAGNLSLSRITLFQRDCRVAREAAGPPAVAWCLSLTRLLPPGQALTLKSCARGSLSREPEWSAFWFALFHIAVVLR